MNSLSDYISKDSINQIFKIDCFEKSEESFWKTHYKLSFNFRSSKASRDVVTSETDLLGTEWVDWGFEKRVNNGVMIRPYVIWGATGTGKTELCRYLELKLRDVDGYKPIRVSKRDLAMGGILGIAQSLTEEKVDITARLLEENGGYHPVDFFRNLLGSMSRFVTTRKKKFRIEEKEGYIGVTYQRLAETIVSNIRERAEQLSPGSDIEMIKSSLRFLKKRECKQEIRDEYDNVIGLVDIDPSINDDIYDALIPIFYGGVKNVQELLYDYISQENELGKIPVFIFDDVTFVGEKIDELIPVISDISSESGYVCDFVIGTTTEFYRKHFKGSFSDTVQARISEIKLSPEGEGNTKSADWLMPLYDENGNNSGLSHFLEFSLRYINGAYTVDKKEISKNVSKEYLDSEDLYYPFTKTFLSNIYKRILHEKNAGEAISLTPREVIKILNQTLVSSYETGNILSDDVDAAFNLSTEYFFKFNDESTYQKFAGYYNAVWWYGEHDTDGEVSISKNLLTTLGLNALSDILDAGKSTVSYPVVNFNTIYDPISRGRKTDGDVKPRDHAVEAEKSRIESWMRGSKDVSIAVSTLQDGINKLIRGINSSFVGSKNYSNFINPVSSRSVGRNDGSMFALQYSFPGNEALFTLTRYPLKDKNKANIFIMPVTSKEENMELIDDDTLCIYFSVTDYYEALRLGEAKTDEDKAEHLAILLRNHIDDFHNVLQLQNDELKRQLEISLGCSLDAYCLSAYIVLGKLLNPKTLLLNTYQCPEDIFQYYLNHGSVDIQRNMLPSGIQDSYPGKDTYSLTEGLFLSLFTLGGGDLLLGRIDYPKLLATLAEINGNPYEILTNVDEKAIPKEFEIVKSGSKTKIKFADYVQGIKKSIQNILHQSIKFDEKRYLEVKEQLNNVGDYDSFKKQYYEFTHNLSDLRISDAELRRHFNKISDKDFRDTVTQLGEIYSTWHNISKLNSTQEMIIVELLCSYLFTLIDESDLSKFLDKLDLTIERAESESRAKISFNIDSLRTSIENYIKIIQEFDS